MAAIGPDSPLRRQPQLADVSRDTLPKAEWLATPEVRTLLGYTRQILHLQDGHTLGVFSFSGSAPANWLFLVDSRDLSAERYAIPNNDIGSHGCALGADGHIYVMPYGKGRAYRFDVRARQFEPLETGLPLKEYTWGAYGASNGCIYFGTYPNAYLGEYNTATGKCELWKQAIPNKKYTHTLSEEADGRIRFKGLGPGEAWMLFDPKTRTFEPTDAPKGGSGSPPLPAAPKGDQAFHRRITADERRFAVGFPTSRLWEVADDGTLALRGDPEAPAEEWFLESVEGALVGISHFGKVFRLDLASNTFRCGHLDNRAPGGNAIMFIETVSPRCVIGANYSQQNLFKIDPDTGQVEAAERMIARVTGEPMCAVGFGGKAYLGIYVWSLLSVYDPAEPFVFGKNPREIFELGRPYNQTRPRAAVTAKGLVFITSDSAYNHLGGALAVVDPRTEKVDVYHHLIRDQNLPTLAFDPATGLLWGGTDRWGQMRSHPPTQAGSLVYAFDPDTRKVVATVTPWPDSDMTNVAGVSQNGILVASSGNELALVDTRSRDILYKGASPIGVPYRLRIGSDGMPYCITNGTLYQWDLESNRITPVATSPGCYHLTEPLPGAWLMANATSVYRLRLTDRQTAP